MMIPAVILTFSAPTIFFTLSLVSANARNSRLHAQIKTYQGLLDQMNSACDQYKAANAVLTKALDQTVAALRGAAPNPGCSVQPGETAP